MLLNTTLLHNHPNIHSKYKESKICIQGWELSHSLIAHLLIAHLLICSFAQIAQDKWVNVSNLFRSLRTNERLWVNCSGRAWQISKFERFAQVTQDKWANEQIAGFFWANCSFFSFVYTKLAIRSKKFEKSYVLYDFTVFWSWKKKKKIRSFFLSSEQIAQVAQDKCATVSDSLTSLRRNEWLWANRSGRSPKMSERAYCSLFEQMAHMLTF